MEPDSDPFFEPLLDDQRLRVGISSCLLGEEVRWNAGHKRDRYLTDMLGEYVDFVAVCPEDEVMGTPRERVRLVGDPEQPNMVESESGRDWTPPMRAFIDTKVNTLRDQDLDGYVLKKGSPTCGMERVKIYNEQGNPAGSGRGLFARQLMDAMPRLPVEEEGRLNDPRLRENFIERIFSYHRLREFLGGDPGRAELQTFHRRHKLTLMAHDQESMRELGRRVAEADQGHRSMGEVLQGYADQFMELLSHPASRANRVNVMEHMLGYLREELDASDRHELMQLIEQYRNETVPLVVPITLFRHHFRRHPVDWILEQSFLNPYPAELMLRNHV